MSQLQAEKSGLRQGPVRGRGNRTGGKVPAAGLRRQPVGHPRRAVPQVNGADSHAAHGGAADVDREVPASRTLGGQQRVQVCRGCRNVLRPGAQLVFQLRVGQDGGMQGRCVVAGPLPQCSRPGPSARHRLSLRGGQNPAAAGHVPERSPALQGTAGSRGCPGNSRRGPAGRGRRDFAPRGRGCPQPR